MITIVNNIFTTRVRNTFMLLAMFCSISTAAWGDTWDGTIKNNNNNKIADNDIVLQTPGSPNSASNPYIIDTAKKFAYFMRVVQASWTGRASTFYWKLTTDIDLNGKAWTYGTNNGGSFQGHFDGDGHTISNVSIAVSGNSSHGLFPTIQGASATNLAEVKNLKIDGVTFTSAASRAGTTRVGALAGLVKQATITNVDVRNVTITYNNTITADNRVGGAIGGVENNTVLDNVDVTGVTATFKNTTTGLYLGGVVGYASGTANTSSMVNCDAKTIQVIHQSNITGTTYMGGLVGNANTGLNVINNNTLSGVVTAGVEGPGFTVNVAGTVSTFDVGGLLGYTKGGAHEIKNNKASNISITVNGATAGGSIYLSGFIGYAVGTGSPGTRKTIQGNTVSNPAVTMNGAIGHTTYIGGFLGCADTHTNVLNNKVTSPAISITNNINAAAYVGGAVGAQNGYTLIDGMYVNGGSITGPATDKNVNNNKTFFIGGFLGMQNSSGTADYQPNKFKNIAVSGMTIKLAHYVPATTVTNHKFGVGGIAGTVNTPNQDSKGNRGMPENLITKGVKIYAPFAATSPTVANFNGGTATQTTYTSDNVTTIDAVERSKRNTWLYTDYQLGLSKSVLSGTNDYNAASANGKVKRNYSATPTADINDTNLEWLTVNDATFLKKNRQYDFEYESKTVLWWTRTDNNASYANNDIDQSIYPQSGNNTIATFATSDWKYYMYFYQGVSNAKYVSTDNATSIISGIEANITEAAKLTPLTLSIVNDKENKRGFDARTLTVTPSAAVSSYEWYVDGVKQTDNTSNTLSIKPDWKYGKSIIVNALDGSSHVVASASYALPVGVFKTKTGDAVNSDIKQRGTATNPYILNSEEDLRQLSYLSTCSTGVLWEGIVKPATPYPTNQSQGHYNRAYYELGADITMSSDPFTPISHVGRSNDGTNGTYSQNFIFQGHLDGKGHNISGLKITWGAGQYNGGANVYHGLFGAIGNATATAKWGDSSSSNAVIKNLIISGATLTHDTSNTSFYYNNGTSGNANNCMVGVLAGIVGSNTTIQNIEIRGSQITDAESGDYSLATYGLFVGGAIGSIQNSFGTTVTNLPSNTKIEHIAAQVDITLTHPTFVDTSKGAQVSQLNAGGIIGRFIASSTSQQQTQSVAPKYTFYSGRINAPKAWISPVLAYNRYSADTNYAFFSKIWEGNNNEVGTQVNIEGAHYYKYYIGDSSTDEGAKAITSAYPENTCDWGARSLKYHKDAVENAATYDAKKYQGVNYDALFVGKEGTSLGSFNNDVIDGYYWVWDPVTHFVHMSKEQERPKNAQLSYDGDTFTASMEDGSTPTVYSWQQSFDGVAWTNIDGASEASYKAPMSISPKFIVATLTVGAKTYVTLPGVVLASGETLTPTIKDNGTGSNHNFYIDWQDSSIDGLSITYQWYKSDKTTVIEGMTGNSLSINDTDLNTYGRVVWCRISIKENDVEALSFFLSSGKTVVYVDGTNGVDTNDGWTKEMAVKTIDVANGKLKTVAQGGTWDNNIIVVVGTLNPSSVFKSKGTNPATITGKWEEVDHNAVIIVKEDKISSNENLPNDIYDTQGNFDSSKNGHNCYVLADTKFENLTFKANSSSDGNNFIECHGNDVWFGKGLKMDNFKDLSEDHGNLTGDTQVIPELTIVLTATNLPEAGIRKYTENRTKPQVVTFESGHYGRIMGGRFTNGYFAHTDNNVHTILGSTTNPVWAVLNINIDKDNPVKSTDATKTFTCDINCIIAGLTDGSMYGDYQINMNGGNVRYIVGANQGNAVKNGGSDINNRPSFTPVEGTFGNWGQWPNSSYFGRTVINVDEPKDEQGNKLYKDVTINNLYAGGLGRKIQGDASKENVSIVDMYLYGHTEVNVKSGNISGSVYAGGAGGVIGLNPWDAHVPYASTEDDDPAKAIYKGVQYGDNRTGFGGWSQKQFGTSPLANVTLHNPDGKGDYVTEQLDLANSTTTVNITGGTIGGNVYGGGAGYVSNMPNTVVMQGVGSVFGTTNVNISGNPTINGSVYGGSMGHNGYFGKKNNYGQTINHIAETNGTVNLYITGSEDKYPTINGDIYGGGQGISSTSSTQEYERIATTGNKTLGNNYKTDININIILPESHPFHGNIYGGGQMGMVDGNTNIFLSGGSFTGKVFGGGLGELNHPNKAVVNGDTHVELNGTNVNVYDDIFGGGNIAKVNGDTYVTLYAGKFGGNIFGGGNGKLNGTTVEASADVTGNTNIYIAHDDGGQNQATKKDNFNINVIWDKKWDAANKRFLTWESDKNSFFANGKFLNNHNIYGGGNNACIVGTYASSTIDVATKPTAGTGLASVKVFKGMTPVGLLRTTEWKDSYNDNNNPHFYVFGGGYGKNTKVGNTDVTVNVGGDYGEYSNEVDSPTEQLSKPGSGFNRNSTTDGTDPVTKPVFDNSYGIPNFTVLGALGGGYAGLVANDTKVTIDGKTFLHRVYGGGFGDPNSSENNTTGQVGGNTDVNINGANIYGDVFGGGAGVAAAKNADYDLDNVARVLGKASVTVADDANIYGKVYGGGDMACVGTHKDGTDKYTTMPSSQSIKTSGVWEYQVLPGTYQAFVNILGGNIFGEVYGGGKGVKKADANDYTMVGRIEGNTLVHIACSVFDEENETWNVVPEATENATIPYVWNRIYGGCAYGTVDGNTMVHTEGGMLGLNIFGGGYGDMTISDDQTDSSSGASTASSTLDQVLGKLDTGATFANILGNTKVQIDGGSWIWNRKADTNGNITTWEDANKTVTNGLEGFKLIVAQILQAKTQSELEQIEAVKSIDPNFFNLTTRQFFKNHNIFGGGNRACFVGTYSDTDASSAVTPAPNTGKAEVIINHSPITKIEDGKGNTINMLDPSTVAGLCWYLGINNIEHPQFSVFGAGYGANTKVGNAVVKAQPGVQVNADGAPILYNVTEGDFTADQEVNNKYLNYESDLKAYYDFENQIAEAWNSVSDDEKRRDYGLAVDNVNVTNTYLRFRASQLAWSMGAPNFTFMDIHGGGFSGYVVNNTEVVADCQLNARNIFGAGLGSKPYGTIADQTAANAFTLGQVGGNSDVFIKSGVVSLNVYGGGAGIESYKVGDATTYTDFPNIALVKGKTNVNVYGETIKFTSSSTVPSALIDKRIERTSIFGGVYGGGDVACVGTTANDTKTKYVANDVVSPADGEKKINTETFTSTVNIRGSAIQSQIYAGGKGRTANLCSVTGTQAEPVYGYQKLGAVYGNTRLIVDAADKTYPYETTVQKKTAEPYTSPHIWNRIYGGCQNGTVYGNTLVEINGGSLGHNIFGGGFGNDGTNLGQSVGDDDDDAIASGTGRAAAMVTSADVKGNTNIIINGGEMELTSYWLPETRTWEPATIKGAITYSPQYDPEKRKFKINHNTYGGGNAACVVEGSTYITMNKGLLKNTTVTVPGSETTNFFELPEWKEVYQKVGSPQFSIFGGGYGAETNILGNTNITTATNPDNKGLDDFIPESGYKHFKSEMAVMDIVGGGYSGKVTGATYVNATKGIFARRIFGGGYLGTVRKTNIAYEIADCYDIFGGGLMGDVLQSTNITIGSHSKGNDKDDTWVHGNIYGGNDVSGYINISHNADGYFKENSTTGGTNINIYGGNIDGNVYGAGNGDYLYALDRAGNDKVTVNEHYKLNPDDANSQEYDLVYTVPMRETMPSYKAASDAAKIVNINSWRPLTNRVKITIKGQSADDAVTIKGDVYGGGNSATVQKVYNSGNTVMTGDVNFNIGSYVNIGRVFMGCNGDALFTASEDNAFLSDFQKLNNLQLDDPIDWANDPSNHGISTLYLPTENEQRPIIYPHLLDLYFQPVEMNIQADLKWDGKTADQTQTLTNCTIGTFCCGGNRGNMNVYPMTEGDYATDYTGTKKIGNVLDYLFPAGLTITDKIIGGCNNANYEWYNSEKNTKIYHEGGYLLGEGHTTYPFIKLTIKNQFDPTVVNGAYKGGNVYGGCFETGTVRGDITVDMKSDMLNGKTKATLDKSNELLASDPSFAALNVYGAGYGMESYVYGNTNILFGQGVECSKPVAGTTFNATGTSANFVYGGGQQGNVIGVTNVDVLNGHIYKSVTGGSYSGYVYGSTQIKVGYPKTYTLKAGQAGRYLLKRTDVNNLGVKNKDANNVETPTIKQYINLIPGDVITAGVYDAIYAKYDGSADGITIADKTQYFTSETKTPSVGWDNINIFIDEACYGGGYSLAQGSSVMANNTTVLKYTDQYNINNTYRSGALADLVGGNAKGTTAGFGGNTMMLIGDATSKQGQAADRDHITISKQVMQEANVPNGTDLYGYYYQDKTDATKYHYIYQAGTYYKGGNMPQDASTDGKVYQFDAEGGIFGDGHLSYAEGFRAADVTGYGYADYTVESPKKINTFQRMDLLRLTDNCFTLLGARDYTVNEVSTTPYSISRVGEIQMISSIASDGALGASSSPRSRNFLGFSNNIHYVGAVYSNVLFSDTWHNASGALGGAEDKFTPRKIGDTTPTDVVLTGKSYQAVKQAYIDDYYNTADGIAPKNDATFQRRNDGTAKNMIGIASGYALKIQNVQERYETNASGDKKMKENLYYGPIYGVVEVNLIDCSEDEGGGYVYADNIHDRTSGNEDFLETSGNFVFPFNDSDGRYVVDDCFPTGYDNAQGANGHATQDVHYWYVTGFNYFYNAHITGYTSNSYDADESKGIHFDLNNKDNIMTLAGAKAGQVPKVYSVTWRSAHTDGYQCDLQVRNADNSTVTDASGHRIVTTRKYTEEEAAAENNRHLVVDNNGKKPGEEGYTTTYKEGYTLLTTANDTIIHGYTLGISAAQNGVYSEDQSAWYHLPFESRAHKEGEDIFMQGRIPTALTSDASIGIRLTDRVDNSGSDYYKQHLSEPCEATIVLTLPALDSKGDQRTGYARIKAFYTYDSSTKKYNKVNGNVDVTTKDYYYYYNSVLNRYSPISGLSAVLVKGDNGNYTTATGTITSGSGDYFIETKREYTYTIYLTIDYVQGPSINGNITVENCALPGEMVRVNKKNVRIESDESFAADGYYWRIGKRVKVDGKWNFVDTTPWTKANATANSAVGYDSYQQTEQTGTGKGFFQGANYNKTNDYLDIPAYYYMNGYGIQLGVSMTGLDQIFPVPMQDADQFVVHNYHRMMPHGSTNVNLHLAEAVARAKAEKDEQGGLAQPRIYLSDTQDLAAFVAFLDSVGTVKQIINGEETTTAPEYVKLGARQATQTDVTAGKASNVGDWVANLCEVPRYGEYAQFVVQNDMEIPAGYDVSKYDRDIILKGTVHGEGHVVTGLGTDKALITENRGHIHNLGMASGMMAANGCTEDGKYHCCFEYNAGSSSVNTPVVYRMDGTSIYSYTRDDFRYGRVAYDLNQYYLEARKILAGGDDGCGAESHLKAALGSDDTPAATKAALKYVFDYWANGDYQYARRSDDKTSEVTGITYLRTGTGTDDPNYGSNLTRHDMRHTIDKPRAQEYVAATVDAPESRTGDYLPLFNAAYHTASSFSGDSSPELINDYLYWGQNLQQTPDLYPSTIESLQLSAMTNRVYRTAGYYHSTALDTYYYNAYSNSGKTMGTYVHNPSTTAIDFTAHNDATSYSAGYDGNIYYAPVADNASVFAQFAVGNDVTKNLLVYTPENTSAGNDCYDAVRTLLNYDEKKSESQIVGHHIYGDGSYNAQYLHLVERNSQSGANNDFCCPVEFTVTDKAWYTRNPKEETGYVEAPGKAWESICLPFDVKKATLSEGIQMYSTDGKNASNREWLTDITYFFGNSDNGDHIKHQYWLRTFTAVSGDKATFKRPATEVFPANTPHIVSFPGYRFYEFDMNDQTITFSSDENATVAVTPAPASMGTTYSGAYVYEEGSDSKYAIKLLADNSIAMGDRFEKKAPVFPFRGYLSLSSSAKGSRAIGSDPEVIYISSPHEMPGIDIDDPQRPDDEFTGDYLRVYPIGKQRLCIESSYATTLKVFTPSGQLYRVLEVRPGTATYSGFQPGIYIVNGKKLRAE